MGEYADMMLDGICCQHCGEFIGNEVGYPQTCNDCHHEVSTDEVEREHK